MSGNNPSTDKSRIRDILDSDTPRASDRFRDLADPEAGPSLAGSLPVLEPSIDVRVGAFLQKTTHSFERGEVDWYARRALQEALSSYQVGNYGIGAVAVLVHNGTVYEFNGRNAMVTGPRLHDHAETRALEDLRAFEIRELRTRLNIGEDELARIGVSAPSDSYPQELNEHTSKLTDGIHVVGTLEPCPMCACVEINAGVQTSISNALDGELHFGEDGPEIHGGGAVVGDKIRLLPAVWQSIAKASGLKFTLLQSQPVPEDSHPEILSLRKEMEELSLALFLETREEIDELLARRGQMN